MLKWLEKNQYFMTPKISLSINKFYCNIIMLIPLSIFVIALL